MRRSLLLLALAPLVSAGAVEARLLQVPGDFAQLQAAIDAAADGDSIELAAGSYPARPGGFRIRNNRRRLTIRAAAGATVVLDGRGEETLLSLRNERPGDWRPVVFQRLVFADGFSSEAGTSGGVTLVRAQATFVDCVFRGNTADAPSTGGGAVKALEGSQVTFRGGRFEGNSSGRRGGALSVRDSRVELVGVELIGNRVNLPRHSPSASGGAVYALDSQIVAVDSLFADNQAAWVGGAIYLFGRWRDPGAGPPATLEVQRSTFRANRAAADGCCASAGPSGGGAVHVEDHALARFHQTAFFANRAEIGGALQGYRSTLEVSASQFHGNGAAQGTELAAGGAIAVNSADFADPSTEQGAINRSPALLLVERSLFDGGGAAALVAHAGGCISANGDANRLEGKGGVAQDGGPAENRAVVSLRRVALHDCDISRAPGGGPALGGGVGGRLIDLLLEDSLVLSSDARGEGGGGGGVAVAAESVAVVRRTTFATNSAERWGGALWVAGSALEVSASAFVANVLSPGVAEPATDSRGAALLTIPQLDADRQRDVAGTVADSVFSANDGLPVWDVDPQQGPINAVRYHRNQFFSPRFGALVYVDTLAAPGGLSPAQLNSLVVQRGARPSTDKSDGGNSQVGAPPRLGALLALPAAGAAGDPAAEILAYAWSGGAASLAGVPLAGRGGLLPAPGAGVQDLRVDGVIAAQAQSGGPCTAGSFLCLAGNRFVATVEWRDFQGRPGFGQGVSITGDTGYFWFFDPANVELVTKAVDGRALNDHFWVFYGALSSVEYTLTLRDAVTGETRAYRNPPGRVASAGDTRAFPASASGGAALGAGLADAAPPALAAASCAAAPAILCLRGGRFRIEATWRDFQGATGAGQAVALTSDTGYFWFFGPSNVEVIVKVLDGTPLNGHFWFFAGSLSSVEYTLTVTDTATGRSKTYRNDAGEFRSIADTAALPDR
jgi:hypothetical protein